ncbi:hypothetical protein D7V93_41325 [Corallococcus llansteffanensis]|uniref:Uncharacterized protein n=1 Tax=Corallococcus llansteffanensis TaxID=2316731 RepID=A0A3A8NFS7_9BACT|nr:hypothetical protein D7V93_41325 [Corallococcus llansteffanensis]
MDEGSAITVATWGQVLTATFTAALPAPVLTVTVTLREAEAPLESVTVSVSTTGPADAGAVQMVVRLAAALKIPVLAVQAYVRVSPAFGSSAVACRATTPPGATVPGLATREVIRGAALSKGAGGFTSCSSSVTAVVWPARMVTGVTWPS